MWAAHYIDGEEVSREEFFRRTTASERFTLDKWQAGAGAPPLYANADEWQADMEELLLAHDDYDYDAATARRVAAAEARIWAESEHGRSAGDAPTYPPNRPHAD